MGTKSKKKVFKFCLYFLLSLPKTILFNFRSLPFCQAVRLPIIVGYNVKVLETHRNIIFFSDRVKKLKFGMIRFGFGGPKGIVSNRRGEIVLEKGKLIFDGEAFFGEGSSIRINAILHIGKHFSSSKNAFIACSADCSSIGDDVMFGWNVAVRDSDGHTVYHDGEPKKSQIPFKIGNHVWVCAEAHILKVVELGDNSIVAYRSTVVKSFPQKGLLIGGAPAVPLQDNIDWGPFIG